MKSPISYKDKTEFKNIKSARNKHDLKLKDMDKYPGIKLAKDSKVSISVFSEKERTENDQKAFEEKIQNTTEKIQEIKAKDKEILVLKKRKVLFRAILNITTSVITNLSFFLVQTLNLAFLGHNGNLVDINSAQLGTMYLNTCGYVFCLGGMNAFDSLGAQYYASKKFDKLYKVYNHNKILTLLIYLIIMLPLGFISKYILTFIRIDSQLIQPSSTYIQICLMSVFINLYNQINYKFLQIMKKDSIVLFLNLIGLSLHLINCLCFIFTFDLGIIGAGVSMIATSFLNIILSTYFLLRNNPCVGKNLIEIDTDSLISSRFYTYAKLALTSGIFLSIEFIAFDFIILASVYLDYQSMTSNVIILNFLCTVWIFDFGIANLLTQRIGSYLGNFKKDICYLYIKYDIIIGSILTVGISLLTFIFSYTIPNIYVEDPIVISNVGFVLRWYSLFIFFDSSYHFINGAIKGIQKHSMINFVCSLILILIFIPLGLLFTFAFDYGYKGFWMSNFLSMFCFCLLFGGYFYYLLKELEEKKESKNGDIELFDNTIN